MKVLYERLAELLATPDGLRTFRLLQSAGLIQEPLSPLWERAGERGPEPISIWEPQGDAWVRPDPLPLGDHYATRKVLSKKEAAKGGNFNASRHSVISTICRVREHPVVGTRGQA